MKEYSEQENNQNLIDKYRSKRKDVIAGNPKLGQNKSFSKESIIGLGESSFRKNYYPELQEKIHTLEEINIRNKAIITAIPDILLVSDFQGNIAPLGSRLRIHSPIVDELLSDDYINEALVSCVKSVVESHEVMTSNIEFEVDDEVRYYEIRGHLSELNEVLLIIRDMTSRIELEKKLRYMAERDGLTGVLNRWNFEKELSKYNGSQAKNFGLLIIDINGVKIINDTLGHLAGDMIIKNSAKFISDVFDAFGVVSRIGGDEFGIIMKDVTSVQIEKWIDKLRHIIHVYNDENDKLRISLAFGYAHHVDGRLDTSYMYQEADNNMYQNKLLKNSSNRSHIVKSLMKALEERDFITEGHADRMGDMAVMMGMLLKLPRSQMDKIELLAKFHDIGKVGIPDAILNKPGKLNKEEYKVMQTHSQIGERIAMESGELKDIAPLILKHHERFDGKGYPLGLMGMDIPIECRILAIVDTFDAMTNDRPYREALKPTEAIEELKNCSNTQFDPELVELFVHNYV